MSSRPRNIEFERQLTRHVVRGVIDPWELIEQAEWRAGGGLSAEYVQNAGLVLLDRDFMVEIRNELLDARNYIVWWVEDHVGHPLVPVLERVLEHVILAFYELAATES